MVYKFTKEGKKRTDTFIRELEEKRKEFLDGGKDTADETNLPTADDILSDIEFVGISWDDPDGPCYCNGWGVTDNHDSDLPLLLPLNVILKSRTKLSLRSSGLQDSVISQGTT